MSRSRSRSREFNRNNKVVDFDKAKERRRSARKAREEKANRAKRQTASRRRIAKQRKRALIYIAIIVFILGAVAASVIEIISLEREKMRLESEQKELQQELKKAKGELAELDDPEYIEQQVREKLNMVYPGEILYVSPDEENKINEED